MTGKERVFAVLAGRPVDRLPALPILHSAYARLAGVPLGQYYGDAAVMARAIVEGWRRFGFDGVQLSLGVTGEAEGLGAEVEQPEDGAPLLRRPPLSDCADLGPLAGRDAARGGRMPIYFDAVRRVADAIGGEAFVLSTLRGPLNIASQLRGVEHVLMDMIDRPEAAERLLDFSTDVAIDVSRASLDSGAHGLLFGEATASPNFISPALYRRLVHPRHCRLVGALRAMGWRAVGFHVCGDIRPIFDDLVGTGAAFLDVDYQVPAGEAVVRAGGRVALRGNLDPVSVFLRASPGEVRARAAELRGAVAGGRWILGSGCDISPGVSGANVAAFAEEALRCPSA